MTEARSIAPTLATFAQEKVVLLTGPRQVGKKTLAQSWLAGQGGTYLTWDAPPDRRRILKNEPFDLVGAVVLDELHKYGRWKSYLKGLFDKTRERLQIVVTGSARLDLARRAGESLLGRYELLRLHPFTIGELTHGRAVDPPVSWTELGRDTRHPELSLDDLETLGGFPEPLFRGSKQYHLRWSARRRDLLLKEDLRELTAIRSLSLVEHLWLLLPDRVGSSLSVNALREEIGVAHDTLSAWIDALERLYMVYRLRPFVVRRTRSLTKERKLYLWDWSELNNSAARFENLVASHLLKSAQLWSDQGHGEFELNYYRDRQKREVDFVITDRRKPIVLIECKLTDETIAPSLVALSEKLGGVPHIQLVRTRGVDRGRGAARIVSADRFLAALC